MDFYLNIKKRIIIFFLFPVSCFLFLVVWQGIYFPKDLTFLETNNKLFSIERSQGLFEIAKNLEKEGLIRNNHSFVFYVLIKGKTKDLQAGKYELNAVMTVPEIVKKIVSGETLKIKLTIPEGFNLKQIETQLNQAVPRPVLGKIPRTGLGTALVREFKEGFDFLRDVSDNASLEGFLFPDTYFLEPEMTEREIIKIFLKNFDEKLNDNLRNEIKKQGKTIFEIITMASLIEKEVRTKEDKELVSGVLWKRLKVDMPLQVDATITYITGKKTTKISIKETQIDSPYNTYKYRGLPIGPICNPGLESIVAAVYPKNSEYWYYLSTPEGKTIFSKTLEEHNIAKAKYLK